MTNRTLPLDERLYQYVLDASLREPEVLRRLRMETLRLPQASMQIAPEQGQFLTLLVHLTAARRILEIGTFTGYSALAMALALPADGRLIACDISREWTAMARDYWAEAGVADRIELRLAPALDTIATLLAEGGQDTFDLVFIDADKENYLQYYEQSLRLLRPGGLIAVDNTLWDGAVADAERRDPETVAIRAFNAAVHHDQRVALSLVTIGDGLTLAWKRPASMR